MKRGQSLTYKFLQNVGYGLILVAATACDLTVSSTAEAWGAEIGEERIGYVDIEKVLESVPDIQPARKALLSRYEARKKEIREQEEGLFASRRALERFRSLAWARAESARERAAAPAPAVVVGSGPAVPPSTGTVLLPGTTMPLPPAATTLAGTSGQAPVPVAAPQSTGTLTSPLHDFLVAVSTASAPALAPAATTAVTPTDATTLSPDDQAEISRRESALRDDEAALEVFIRKSEEEFLEREKAVTQQALGRVYDAIDAVKHEGKFTLILDKGLIIHGQEAQDVTPDVVRRLKARRGH